MATRLLEHGDYQGMLPEGWDVVEIPAGMTLVNKADAEKMVKQLKAAKDIIDQTAKLFSMADKLQPGLFSSESVNWGSLFFALTKSQKATDLNLGPEFAKLNNMLSEYSKNYQVTIVR